MTPMSAMYSSLVGMRPRREQMAASSAEPRYTLVFLPRRLGQLRVLVDMTVAPSRTCAWLPMHSAQPGISLRATAVPEPTSWPSSVSCLASIFVGGAHHTLHGLVGFPSP